MLEILAGIAVGVTVFILGTRYSKRTQYAVRNNNEPSIEYEEQYPQLSQEDLDLYVPTESVQPTPPPFTEGVEILFPENERDAEMQERLRSTI